MVGQDGCAHLKPRASLMGEGLQDWFNRAGSGFMGCCSLDTLAGPSFRGSSWLTPSTYAYRFRTGAFWATPSGGGDPLRIEFKRGKGPCTTTSCEVRNFSASLIALVRERTPFSQSEYHSSVSLNDVEENNNGLAGPRGPFWNTLQYDCLLYTSPSPRD